MNEPVQLAATGGPSISAALGALIDDGPFGLMITDRNGVIQWVNATVTDWLGFSATDLVGLRTFQELLAPGGRIYYDTHVRPLLHMQRGVSEIALEIVRSDGTRLAILMSSKLRDGKSSDDQTAEIVLVDATHRRKYEAELLHERRNAERSEARLQVMYDIVSGFAAAITVDDIVRVVAERGSASMSGARCAVWMFGSDATSAVRLGPEHGDGSVLSRVDLPGQAPALDLLARGELVVISDRDASSDYPLLNEWLAANQVRSAAIAPLMIGGTLGGVVSYGYAEPHEFDTVDAQVASALAAQAEQALQRVRLVEAELRGKERIESLLDFTARLSAALTLDDVIDAVVGGSRSLLGAIGVRVALVDAARRRVRFVRGVGVGGRMGSLLPIDAESIGCAVIRTGAMHAVADRAELMERFPASPILSEPESGRVVGVPLTAGDAVVGAWILAFPEEGRDDLDHLKFIRLFAAEAGQATQRAALHDAENAARIQGDLRGVISEALNRALSTSDVGRAITYEGLRAFDAAGLALFVVDPDNPVQLFAESRSGLDDVTVAGATTIDDVAAAADLKNWSSPRFVTGRGKVKAMLGTILEAVEWEAAAILPLGVTGRELGLLLIGFEGRDALSSTMRAALVGLAAEATVALGRARRFDADHDIAITLQRSLLPDVDRLSEGWEVSTWYEPGSELLVVGGDLFDITEFDDGRIVVVVGDVVGHGLQAAASMGLLRSAAKALTLVGEGPSEVIAGLQAFANVTPGVLYSSICCIEVRPDGAGRYASAGHPYPVLRHADGRTELLEGARCALLGVDAAIPSDAAFDMPDGSTLVVYTDGLIERRTTTVDDEMVRLRDYLESAPFPASTARQVVKQMLGDDPSEDDTIVVCLSKTGPSSPDG